MYAPPPTDQQGQAPLTPREKGLISVIMLGVAVLGYAVSYSLAHVLGQAIELGSSEDEFFVLLLLFPGPLVFALATPLTLLLIQRLTRARFYRRGCAAGCAGAPFLYLGGCFASAMLVMFLKDQLRSLIPPGRGRVNELDATQISIVVALVWLLGVPASVALIVSLGRKRA
jgi:hypothetical protein